MYRQSIHLMYALTISILFTLSLFPPSTNALNLRKGFKIDEAYQMPTYLKKGIYVIVGSFNIHENAITYAKSIKIDGESPQVGSKKGEKHHYVYAYATGEDLEFAREKRSELRATSQFYDTWLLYVGLRLEDLKKKELTPDIIVQEKPQEIEPVEKTEQIIPKTTVPTEQGAEIYNFRFDVTNATSLNEVPGYITIIDASRSKTMQSVSTNQVHALNPPNSQSKEIIALCDIFGFVKTQVNFKIDDPMASSDNSLFTHSEEMTTINFELNRHKTGDMLTMYNVYFYNNSAIMKPESKFELNGLLGMLKENDKLEILIHGHTNGNSSGTIIKLEDGDTNFFQVTAKNDEKKGSAKELSKERALIIQKWLIEQGIDKKRMDLKGWGGKRMLYKKTDKLAGRNVRVEIEILKG